MRVGSRLSSGEYSVVDSGEHYGEGVFIGLYSGVEVNSGLILGTGAISGLQDIPSYSTSTPRGTCSAAIWMRFHAWWSF